MRACVRLKRPTDRVRQTEAHKDLASHIGDDQRTEQSLTNASPLVSSRTNATGPYGTRRTGPPPSGIVAATRHRHGQSIRPQQSIQRSIRPKQTTQTTTKYLTHLADATDNNGESDTNGASDPNKASNPDRQQRRIRPQQTPQTTTESVSDPPNRHQQSIRPQQTPTEHQTQTDTNGASDPNRRHKQQRSIRHA